MRGGQACVRPCLSLSLFLSLSPVRSIRESLDGWIPSIPIPITPAVWVQNEFGLAVLPNATRSKTIEKKRTHTERSD